MPLKRKTRAAGAAPATTTTNATPSFITKEATSNSNALLCGGPLGAIINAGTSSSSGKQWRVGKLLGRGACGSVHEVVPVSSTERSGSSSNQRLQSWVIKLAAVPHNKEESVGTSYASGRPRKKRKKTADERNADTIHLEQSLLCNTLLSLQGVYVPSIPQYGQAYAPPPFGEFLLPNMASSSSSSSSTSYTYLVMEKMASSLSDWRPPISNGTVKFGPIAQQMLECLRQIHNLNLVYVDVKLESYMFTEPVPSSSTATGTFNNTGNQTTTSTNWAHSVRLIDFGLVESYYDTMTNKHRQDCGGGNNNTIVGTPLYASIHVMEGHTPSRRDDVEALGYVLMDILSQQGLPWKDATSNQDILQAKKQLKRHNSVSSTILNQHNADLLGKYMDIVYKLTYTEKPNYDSLSQILGHLQGKNDLYKDIPLRPSGSKRCKASATYTTASTNKSTRSRSASTAAAAAASSSSSSSASPSRNTTTTQKKKKSNPTTKIASSVKSNNDQRDGKRKTNKPVEVNMKKQQSEVIIDLSNDNDDNDNDAYNNTNDDLPIPMDWEITEREETESNPNSILDTPQKTQKVKTNKKQEFDSLKLQFMEGPAKGECVEVQSTLTIGRYQDSQNTTSKKKCSHHFTVRDPNIALQQLKITFCETKFKSYSIRVANVNKDPSSKGSAKCYVKGKLLAQGESIQCFAGDKIQFGSSTLIVIKG